MLVTILAEIAELETVRLSQRIKSGMAKARREGQVLGRPKGSTSDIHSKIKDDPKYRKAAKALKDNLSLRKTAAFSDLSINTVRKIKSTIN